MRQFDGDVEHVQRIHGHPGGAVALLNRAAIGEGIAAVEHANVVEAEEAALKDIVARLIHPVGPPGVTHQEFIEGFLQEFAVTRSGHAALDGIDPPRRPAADGGIGVGKRPLIRRHLCAG